MMGWYHNLSDTLNILDFVLDAIPLMILWRMRKKKRKRRKRDADE
jgi:hypothetical protein